jgi:hypothetical protein
MNQEIPKRIILPGTAAASRLTASLYSQPFGKFDALGRSRYAEAKGAFGDGVKGMIWFLIVRLR